MTAASDYGKEVRLIRDMMHLTQAELGTLLGVTGNAIMRYETGRRQVPEPTMRLARQLLRMKEASRQEDGTGE